VAEGDVLDRIDAHLARFIELHQDTRQFVRDVTTRNERIVNQLVERLDAQTDELVEHRAVLLDLHEESVAHRKALLRILDRLDPDG
jgi:hypothetical protein